MSTLRTDNLQTTDSSVTIAVSDLEKTVGRLTTTVNLTDFSGAVEGANNNSSAAFVQAEASAAQAIFLPYGVWNAAGTVLTKHYYGLGKLITNGSYRGQQYQSIQTDPQKPTNADFEFAATGDISKVNVTRYNLGRIRNNLDEYYFNSTTTPFWSDMVSQAGHSGTSGKFTNVLGIGGTTISMVGTAPEITAGMPVRISNDDQSFEATCVSNTGTTLTFTPGSPYNFNVSYTTTTPPTYGYVTRAIRTMNTLHMGEVEHQGGGDSYVWTGRIINNNKYTQPAQNHFFETSTIGLIGGDLLNVVHGGFMTGTEINMTDSNYQGSFQSAAMGHLVNLQRTADQGTFGCPWIGFYTKSEASAHADVAYRATGRFKRGLDLGGVSFDGDQAAITMNRGTRIYLDATGTAIDSRGGNWWSDTPGGAWIGTGTGGDIILTQNNQFRVVLDDVNTNLLSTTTTGSVVVQRGFFDFGAGNTATTAGALAIYKIVKVGGTSYKLPLYAL